ncbi:MAG: carbonic anhydrase [Bacteroidia bacterium]|jgi:carbonic anhydrase|nr:carbonic anhydrase [Paludibacter sp.]MDD3489760.1 carbonic anhydrase [Paludibacter sp.]NCB68597.1 carbonic anhydrase [Bacteroidia bacterium]
MPDKNSDIQSLFDGVREFNSVEFERYRELFGKIGRSQDPHTLFIGCSDSRVVPNLITKTQPGELFMVRNIANIVPMYRESEEFLSTTSAIEYAVQVLNVSTIIVCGHSNCGGCNALFADESTLKHIPHTRKWLELSKAVREKLTRLHIADPDVREWMSEQLNVVEQMRHLLTYPYIAERYRNGDLKILGWYYIIETGEVFDYQSDIRRFVKIQ